MDDQEKDINEALGLFKYYIIQLYLDHPHWEKSQKYKTYSVRAVCEEDAKEEAVERALQSNTAVSKRQITVKGCYVMTFQGP